MRYTDFINLLEPGDAILIDNDSFISKLIKVFQENSHIGVYADGGNMIHQTYPIAMESPLKEYLQDKEVTVRRIKNLSSCQAMDIVSEAYKDVDTKKPYNTKGLVAGFPIFLFLKRLGINLVYNPYSDRATSVCSTAYIEWVRRASIQAFAFVGQGLGTPDDILFSSDMITVIEKCKIDVS